MKRLPQNIVYWVKTVFTPQTAEERERILSARPFFVVMVLTVIGLWGYAVFSLPQLRMPVKFLLFTGLIMVHGLLHWFTPILAYRPRISLVYMIAQGLVAFSIISLLKNITAILLLYSVLLGESVGVLRGRWQRLVGGIFQFASLIASILLFSGWDNMISSLWPFMLMVAIILPYIISFGQQDAARQKAQSLLHELEETHEQLTRYALQVEELTRLHERERIARELHDTLSQGLAGIILQLEAAISHLEEDNPNQTITILEHTLSSARQALSESRKTIGVLRQSDTVPGNLRTQIQAEVNRFSNVSRVPYTLDIGSIDQLSETVHQHILRILAEALSNITRHAQATGAIITAHCNRGDFTMTIRDDGIGFVPEAVPTGHFGLLGIKERARLIGANLVIHSVIGQGTTIELTLPLDERTTS